jgi:hypothetical protein
MADDDVLSWPVRTAEYMHFDITANVDPLADPVKVALTGHRTPPEDGAYEPAEWAPGQTWVDQGTTLTVRLFVDKDTLTRGNRYDAWVQVSDSPEVPEIFAGVVKGV